MRISNPVVRNAKFAHVKFVSTKFSPPRVLGQNCFRVLSCVISSAGSFVHALSHSKREAENFNREEFKKPTLFPGIFYGAVPLSYSGSKNGLHFAEAFTALVLHWPQEDSCGPWLLLCSVFLLTALQGKGDFFAMFPSKSHSLCLVVAFYSVSNFNCPRQAACRQQHKKIATQTLQY